MSHLRVVFAPYWQSIQQALFSQLECVLGPLTGKQQQVVQTLEVIRIEQVIPPRFRVPGRPRKDRAAMARAFVAKAVYDLPTTRGLRDRLDTEPYRVFRRLHFLGGWGPWEDRADTHQRFESERSGWYSSTKTSTTRSGRRSGPSPRRSDVHRKRSDIGCGERNGIRAVARG